MRYFLGMVLFTLGCGPAEQPPAETYQVSASGLIAHYRDNPHGTAYTNHRIQVRLEPRTYAVTAEGEVHVFTGLPRTPPVIVFRCVERLDGIDAERHWLVVTGVCRGATRDGIRKADRVLFTVHVDECRVTRVETQ